MKLFYQTLFCSGLLLQVASAQADRTPYGYRNFLTKTQLPSGPEIYAGNYLVSSGKMFGEKFTQTGGIQYRLYTVRNTLTGLKPAGKVPLDEKTIGLFVPRATLVISSGDPYTSPGSNIKRTRADKGFSVTVTPSGLISDPTKHECFRKVNLFRTTQSYGPGSSDDRQIPDPNTNSVIDAPTLALSENNSFSFSFGPRTLSQLEGELACGQVSFETKSLKDDQLTGQIIDEKILASQMIRIWPISNGEVLKYEGMGQVYKEQIPNINFRATNLYPGSVTYLQYYYGSPVVGKIGTKLTNTEFRNTADYSVHKTIGIDNSTLLFNRDGTWTLELITETPDSFGDRRSLAKTEVSVDRSIIVNTTLTTSE